MDTIRLKFPHPVPENNQFFKETVLGKDITPGEPNGKRHVLTNNTWRKERQVQGFYVPKYGIEQDFGGYETYLVIELSLPKLLYGQNITELSDSDFMPCVEALSTFLRTIGAHVFKQQIIMAKPILVAVSKNINLTSLCSTDFALNALRPFDYKPHAKYRAVEFADQKHGGREVVFSIASETFKIYSKTDEVINNASTTKEKEIAEALAANRYQIDKVYINEILRVELTLKTPAKVQSRFLALLNGQPVTFENIFKQSLWEELLRQQMLLIYDHPLKDFVFLASEQKPYIQAFLDQNHKHIETKDTVMGIIGSIQEYGLAKTRSVYQQKYTSRQTWHNYQQRLMAISKKLDFSTLESLTNYQIYRYILRQFGIDTRQQGQFDLQTMSKKLDTERRNTSERLL